jgi:hypothetical protein
MTAVLACSVALVPALSTADVAHADLAAGTNTIAIKAGGSGSLPFTVTVPRLPARADIQIAIDTTGSQSGVIAQAKAQASDLVNTIHDVVPDTQFSVVDFRDSSDGSAEYVIKQSVTSDASAVQAAIESMSAAGGGDYPEAQNLVLAKAATDDPALWRANSRKFVVLITDAPPHGAAANGFQSCSDTSSDPHGLNTNTVVADLAAAQRTFFAVTPASVMGSLMVGCYNDITAASMPGSVQQPLGSNLGNQIHALIEAASATVSDVHLEVAGQNPNAGWIKFSPAARGSLSTPASIPFTATVTVPPGTPAGDQQFDIMALADGGDVGHQALTVTVLPGNSPPVCTEASAAQSVIWAPNHRMVNVDVVGVTDPEGGPTQVTFTAVTQDESLNAVGDGTTAVDASIHAGGSTAEVRAERSGTGDGRVYALTFTADDSGGATCSGTVRVAVPHDLRHGAVDSGQKYNSLG